MVKGLPSDNTESINNVLMKVLLSRGGLSQSKQRSNFKQIWKNGKELCSGIFSIKILVLLLFYVVFCLISFQNVCQCRNFYPINPIKREPSYDIPIKLDIQIKVTLVNTCLDDSQSNVTIYKIIILQSPSWSFPGLSSALRQMPGNLCTAPRII